MTGNYLLSIVFTGRMQMGIEIALNNLFVVSYFVNSRSGQKWWLSWLNHVKAGLQATSSGWGLSSSEKGPLKVLSEGRYRFRQKI